MTKARSLLGPLPSKFTRLEQPLPAAWPKVPPTLIDCPLSPVFVGQKGETKSSHGANCGPVSTKTWTYLREPMGELPEGDYPYDVEYRDKMKALHKASPEEIKWSIIKTRDGEGIYEWVGGDSPPDACSVTTTMVDDSEDFFDYLGEFTAQTIHGIKNYPSTETVTSLGVAYSLSGIETVWQPVMDAPVPSPSFPVDFDSTVGTVVTGERQPPPEGPPMPGPNTAYSGWYRRNTSEASHWYWEIDSEDIYEPEHWPLDSSGSPATLTGTLRWQVIETSRPITAVTGGGVSIYGPWEEEPDSIFYDSVAFSIDLGEVWQSPTQTLSTTGGVSKQIKKQALLTHALLRNPVAAMEAPDYTSFTYLP
jgi:hypothetical protein